MMKNFFSRFFCKNSKSKPLTQERGHQYYLYYLKILIKKSKLIKKEKKKHVIKMFSLEGKTVKGSGDLLSLEEKEALGLDVHFHIDRSFFPVLTDNWSQYYRSPRFVLGFIVRNALALSCLRSKNERSQSSGIKEVEFVVVNKNLACSWCLEMEGKRLSLSVDIASLVIDNCKCNEGIQIGTKAIMPWEK